MKRGILNPLASSGFPFVRYACLIVKCWIPFRSLRLEKLNSCLYSYLLMVLKQRWSRCNTGPGLALLASPSLKVVCLALNCALFGKWLL